MLTNKKNAFITTISLIISQFTYTSNNNCHDFNIDDANKKNVYIKNTGKYNPNNNNSFAMTKEEFNEATMGENPAYLPFIILLPPPQNDKDITAQIGPYDMDTNFNLFEPNIFYGPTLMPFFLNLPKGNSCTLPTEKYDVLQFSGYQYLIELFGPNRTVSVAILYENNESFYSVKPLTDNIIFTILPFEINKTTKVKKI
jgi:hypothetical protein